MADTDGKLDETAGDSIDSRIDLQCDQFEPAWKTEERPNIEAVARVVHEALEHNVLLRDLKPACIVIESKSDRSLVTHFGLA